MSNYAKLEETVKRKGALAYFSGQTVEQCPYSTPGKQGRKFRRLWLGGYVAARDLGIYCDACQQKLTTLTGANYLTTCVLCDNCFKMNKGNGDASS